MERAVAREIDTVPATSGGCVHPFADVTQDRVPDEGRVEIPVKEDR